MKLFPIPKHFPIKLNENGGMCGKKLASSNKISYSLSITSKTLLFPSIIL